MWIVGVRDWRCHVLAVTSPVVVHGLFYGNLTILLLVPLALAWRYRDSRADRRAWPMAVAVAAKLFAWPLVVWLLLTRRFRAAAWAAVAAAVLLVLAAWAVDRVRGAGRLPGAPRGDPGRLRGAQRVGRDGRRQRSGCPSTLRSPSASLRVCGLARGLARRSLPGGQTASGARSPSLWPRASLRRPIVWPNYAALLLVPIALTWPRLAPAWFFGYVVWLVGAIAPKPVVDGRLLQTSGRARSGLGPEPCGRRRVACGRHDAGPCRVGSDRKLDSTLGDTRSRRRGRPHVDLDLLESSFGLGNSNVSSPTQMRASAPRTSRTTSDRVRRASASKTYVGSLLVLLAATIAARVFYASYAGLRFDAETLDYYFQFVDPVLLRDHLLESVFHLHSQPPLFNLFVGVVLKLFPSQYAVAFNVIYVGFGVVLILSMFHLQLRLGVRPRLAAVVTGVFAVSPVTALYENWLYTTYLVAAILTVAALFLHRYLTNERLGDAVGFFTALGVVVLTRGSYHPLWFLLPALAVLCAVPRVRRRTLISMAIPLTLVIAVSVHQYVQFGSLTNGRVYQELNLAQMTTLRLPAETRERLIRSGRISEINNLPIYAAKAGDYAPYFAPPAPTGIAVLDQQVKSTGAANWHSSAFRDVAHRYGKDGRFVLRTYPGLYLSALRENVAHFFRPADQSDPFRVSESRGARSTPLTDRMWSVTRAWDVLTAGQLRYEGVAFLGVLALLASVAYAFFFFFRWFARRKPPRIRGDRSARADAVTVLFMVYTFVYVGVVTILFSSDDHSRYRFEVAPLACVLLAMLLSEVWHRRRADRASAAGDSRGSRNRSPWIRTRLTVSAAGADRTREAAPGLDEGIATIRSGGRGIRHLRQAVFP